MATTWTIAIDWDRDGERTVLGLSRHHPNPVGRELHPHLIAHV